MPNGLRTITFATPRGAVSAWTGTRGRKSMSPEHVETEVEGRRLTLSNLSKVLYPANGFTKGAVLDYYARIAPVMLPHIEDRPMTLRRFPNGVDGQSFFKNLWPEHAPF